MPTKVESYHTQCLYDVQWQLLRLTFLGKWSDPLTSGDNLEILERYVNDKVEGEADHPERVWRALNLLNAVLLGFGRNHPMGYDEIVAARDRLTRLHEQTPLRPPKTGWAGSRTAAQLHYATLPDLILLRKNLMRRVNTAMSRHQTLDSRPELARFINLVDAEIARRNSHHVS